MERYEKMTKTAETTVATLDLGQTCMLTLTNKHLRGQVTRYVEVGRTQSGQPIKKLQKDTLDVLLSGVAGYSLDFYDKKLQRIATMIAGVLVAVIGLVLGIKGTSELYWGLPVGVLMFLWGMKFPKDAWAFAINVMGGKNEIPVAAGHTELVREFITKLQNAKIAYEEQ